jgi:hypothetical protein
MQVTNLIGIVIQQKVKYEELKQQSIDKQRFAFFKGDTHVWVDETRAESDTHVYWACNACVPKWNKKTGIYIKRDASAGCTYDKATKKFKWWFGKNAVLNGPNLVKDMCNYFKAEWFTNSPLGLQNSTTNCTLSKVLLGKITNPRDLIKSIIKVNPTMRGMHISTELVWDYINKKAGQKVQSLADFIDVAKDPNHAIEYAIDMEYMTFELSDLLKQAQMLNRKIDFKWSPKRILEVHNEWTKEIMDIEQDSVEKFDYNYINELPCNGSLELITDNKELYVEGRIMRHCVYTNYADSVKNKTYFVLRFTDRDERATVGITKYYDSYGFVINQMYGKSNKTVAQCHQDYVKEWLERSDVQQWFKDNYKVNSLGDQIQLQQVGWV